MNSNTLNAFYETESSPKGPRSGSCRMWAQDIVGPHRPIRHKRLYCSRFRTHCETDSCPATSRVPLSRRSAGNTLDRTAAVDRSGRWPLAPVRGFSGHRHGSGEPTQHEPSAGIGPIGRNTRFGRFAASLLPASRFAPIAKRTHRSGRCGPTRIQQASIAAERRF